MKFLESVKKYMSEYDMLHPGDGVIIGVSGGADSVALLQTLLMVGKNIHIRTVHINHGIRGEEADRDQHFVENLAEELGVTCRVYKADIPAMAERMHLTVEEAGRYFRYECFEREAEELSEALSPDAQVRIAVAHNKDDLAETVLYNMIRGSSLTGLAGIRPVRDRIIRPLLMTPRRDIEKFLEEIGQDYVTDSTNLGVDYTRNKLRHTVIPELSRINERAVDHIAEIALDAERLREELSRKCSDVLSPDQILKPKISVININIEALQQCDSLQRGEVILSAMERLCGRRKDITRAHIYSVAALCDKESGKRVNLPYGIVAERVYERLKLYIADNSDVNSEISNKEDVQMTFESILNNTFRSDLEDYFTVEHISIDKISEISRDEYTKMIDCDKICDKLSFRYPEPDDFIVTRADGGRKKLSRFFTDNKVERERRDRMPVVADGHEIIWVVGLRLSERYKVTEDTKTVVKICCVNLS